MKKWILPVLLISMSLASCATDFFSGGSSNVDEVDTLIINNVTITSASGEMKVTYDSPNLNPFKYPGFKFSHLLVNNKAVTSYFATDSTFSSQYFNVTPNSSELNKSSYSFEWIADDGLPYLKGKSSNVTPYDGGGSIPDPDEPVIPTGYTRIAFQDEFNSSYVDSSKWDYDIGGHGWGNGESQYYTNRNSIVSGGHLHIQAKKETQGSNQYTSARMVTRGKYSFKYGYIEAKISLPEVQGMWPAFWMLPEENAYGGWPYSGEIDIMEAKGRIVDKSSSALHFTTEEGAHTYLSHEQRFDSSAGSLEEFHIYACEWKQNEIKFYVDGRLHLSINNTQWQTSAALSNELAPFDKNFHLILNLAIGGHFDDYTLPPSGFTQAEMLVDYVRVYQ